MNTIYQNLIQSKLFKNFVYNYNNNSYFFWLINFITFFLLYLIVVPMEFYSGEVSFFQFQGRDIQRSIDFLNGKMIFFGPELTGGGNLPGPFYYLLLAIPLYFKPNWYSVWVFFYYLTFISFYAISCLVINKRNQFIIQLSMFLSLTISSLFTVGNQQFTNASFAIPFSAFIFCLLLFTDKPKVKSKKPYLYLTSFLIGLTIQLHYSTIIFLLSIFYFVFFQLEIKNLKDKVLTSINCFIFFLFPLLPYFFWKIFPDALSSQALYFNIDSSRSIPSILFLAKNGFSIFFNEEQFNLIEVFFFLLRLIKHYPWPAFIFTFLLFNSKRSKLFKNNYLTPILLASIFGFFAYAFFIHTKRYLHPEAIVVCIIYYLNFRKILRLKKLRLFLYSISLAALAVCIILFSIYAPESFHVINWIILLLFLVCLVLFFSKLKKLNLFGFILCNLITCTYPSLFLPKDGFLLTTKDLEAIYNQFYYSTGRRLEGFTGKIYLLNFISSADFLTYSKNYDYLKPEYSKGIKPNTKLKIDGVIIANRRLIDAEGRIDKPVNLFSFFRMSKMHGDFLNFISSGIIKMSKPIFSSKLIYPYTFSNKENFEGSIQNLSMGNKPSQELFNFLNRIPSKAEGKNYFFVWNDCPNQNKYCEYGMEVNLNKVNLNYYINVGVHGMTLSNKSPWVTQNLTQSLLNLYVDITCIDGSVEKIPVSTSVGYNYYYNTPGENYFNRNNSVTAPLHIKQKIKCLKPISISCGYGKVIVDDIYSSNKYPGKHQTISI